MTKDWTEFLKQAKTTARERFDYHVEQARMGAPINGLAGMEQHKSMAHEAAFWVGYFSARLHTVAGIPVTRILRDGEPVAEFTDASLARMALVMFQSNEAANGNTAHAWTLEGE